MKIFFVRPFVYMKPQEPQLLLVVDLLVAVLRVLQIAASVQLPLITKVR
jgi:hypothetical protein